jgi:hypothetical protein
MERKNELIALIAKEEAKQSNLIKTRCNVIGCSNCERKFTEVVLGKAVEVCESDKLQKSISDLQDELWLLL